jgi:IS1 family transposase
VSSEVKALAVLLYGRGKASYGFIAKLFGVTPVSVMRWFKEISGRLPQPVVDSTLREVEFDEMWHFLHKKEKLWIWRAVSRVGNKTIGWFVGDRSADSFREFFERFRGLKEAVFYTDNWEAYSEVIPSNQHVIGKRHTIGIEQNNSNIRHFIGRMTRRTKVASKSA